MALERIESFCEAINSIYKPGCKVTIFSDGRVFSDLVGVDDKLVNGYGEVCQCYCISISIIVAQRISSLLIPIILLSYDCICLT